MLAHVVKFRKRRLHSVLITQSLFLFVVLAGCHSKPPSDSSVLDDTDRTRDAVQVALREMRSHAQLQRWEEAWMTSQRLFPALENDVNLVLEVADIAEQAQHVNESAELLKDVCEHTGYSDPVLVDRAMAQFMAAGRIFGAISVLEQAVEFQPTQHQTRRSLFEAYLSTENYQQAAYHGQYLVRERQFDTSLLFSLGAVGTRTEPTTVLTAMVRKYPADRRPLIAEARRSFDQGEMDAAADLLRQILELHPQDVSAFVLLGRVLIATNDLKTYAVLNLSPPSEVQQDAMHWINMGDWYFATQQSLQACRCYWESTKRDPDRQESWAKLARCCVLDSGNSAKELQLTDFQLRHAQGRAEQLGQIVQLKRDFKAQLLDRARIAIELAKTHESLGHLWEAEAWAAIATKIANDNELEGAEMVRQGIVRKLRRDAPWQETSSRPEFSIDISTVPLPETISMDSVPALEEHEVSKTTYSFVLNNEAEKRNLEFFGRTAEDLERPGVALYQTTGCGGGSIDFDLNGWPDLYLVTAGGTPPARDSDANSLFRNQDGIFVDVTEVSKTGDTGFGQGVAAGDVNEDGFADLLVLNYGANTLLMNNGDGTFCDQSNRLHENAEQQLLWSTSGAVADIDADGLSDLVVLNYCDGLEPVTQPCPRDDEKIVRSCAPITFPAALDRFLKSEPSGDFTDVTETWGAAPSVIGRGLGVTIGNLDNRPGNDVFVANDMTVNHFWSRSGALAFGLSDYAIINGLASGDQNVAQGSMGIISQDFDFDGDADMLVTNFVGETNTYHEQVSPGIWRDQTVVSGLGDETLSMVAFGTQAIDFDNDGVLEAIVSNGHIDDFSVSGSNSSYAQPIQLFAAKDAATRDFKVPKKATYRLANDAVVSDYFQVPHIGRSVWVLDANRDGKMDVAVTHQSEPVALLMNSSSNAGHWLNLQVVGRYSARDAIGTQLSLASERGTQHKPVTSGDGYMCSNQRISHFGLGDSVEPCELTVRWPSGSEQKFSSLAVDTCWLIVESESEAFRLPGLSAP